MSQRDRSRASDRRFQPRLSEQLESRDLLSIFGPASVHHQKPVGPSTQELAPSAKKAASLSTLTVPLTLVHVGSQERLAVNVSIGGGAMLPYLLDTGSTGMYAANYNLNKNAYTKVGKSFKQHYTSGIQYSGPVIQTTVSFASGQTASNVDIGLITSATGAPVAGWQQALKTNQPPYEGQFFGTLGMSLTPGKAGKQGTLYSVIAQLPDNLNSGFIIHTGGINGTHPTLTIGLTPQNTQGFTTINLKPSGGAGTTYSYGNGQSNGVLAWDDKSTKLNYQIGSSYAVSAKTVFDTGEAATVVYTGKVPKSLQTNGRIKSGTAFSASHGSALNWQFTTGNTVNVNKVQVGPARKKQTVNTGIGIFFSYDIMYDIQDGKIGFRPVTSG